MRRAALDAHVAPEQVVHRQVPVRHADQSDVAAVADAADRLQPGLLGSDALQHAVRADPVGQLPDRSHARLVALCDDVGGTELAGHLLAGRVAAHRDHRGCAQLHCSEHRAEPDSAVTDDGHGGVRPDARRDGRMPTRAHHV